MKILGEHILIEYSKANTAVLNDEHAIRSMMIEAAKAIEVEVLHSYFHRFQPQGITGVLVIAESHLTIHTWPEFDYAAVDIFTCGDTSLLAKAVSLLKERLFAKEVSEKKIKRGPHSAKN